jgi:pyrophosphatase PpaX
MIKAVLFDVDGVLLDSFEANLQFYRNLLKKASYIPPTEKEFRPLMHYTMEKVIRELLPNASDSEIQRIWETGKNFVDELYLYQLLKTRKDATKSIRVLYKKYQLGIVTSRINGGVYTIPQLKKLEQYFQVTVGFEDTTNHKPHPEPLLFACKKLGLEPNEIVYIGDAHSDIIAGKAAGMKVILFAEKNFFDADEWTNSFKNLSDIISKL